jgi:hypothetical protein
MSINKNFFLAERRARVKLLIRLFKDHPDMSYARIKGLFGLRTGLAHKTINAYVNELVDGGILEWNDEKKTYVSLL